ncbi:MAG: HEPN domain-containing protein [Myxococcota bacterium]|nr:HEPN domain-containing protein [Myxococcota bacterium]
MTSGQEWLRWLRDAEQCLDGARGAVQQGHWRSVCLMAQLAIELAAKAVIAAFVEPHWTHDPSGQLRAGVLARSDEEIEAVFGADACGAIERLAGDVAETAEWHGWATYGRRLPDRTWRAAADVCTEDAARDLLLRAERSVATAARLRIHAKP